MLNSAEHEIQIIHKYLDIFYYYLAKNLHLLCKLKTGSGECTQSMF